MRDAVECVAYLVVLESTGIAEHELRGGRFPLDQLLLRS